MASRAQNESISQYVAVVGRHEERSRLLARVQKRKSMLVYGPEGVGKSRFLVEFAKSHAQALYIRAFDAPRELALGLIARLRESSARTLRLPSDPKVMSTSSLKGIIQRALDQADFFLVLDHLAGPSRITTAMIKEFHYYGRTPLYFAARTPHMEDIGTLIPLCSDKAERMEMKNFPASVALEFAKRETERIRLTAPNLDEAMQFITDKSEGNPGAILQMVAMAQRAEYRVDNQIKVHTLYLDFCMGRR